MKSFKEMYPEFDFGANAPVGKPKSFRDLYQTQEETQQPENEEFQLGHIPDWIMGGAGQLVKSIGESAEDLSRNWIYNDPSDYDKNPNTFIHQFAELGKKTGNLLTEKNYHQYEDGSIPYHFQNAFNSYPTSLGTMAVSAPIGYVFGGPLGAGGAAVRSALSQSPKLAQLLSSLASAYNNSKVARTLIPNDPRLITAVESGAGIESYLESLETEKKALKAGMSPEEARAARDQNFWTNMAIISAFNMPQYNALFGTTARGLLGKLGRGAIVAGSEGAEETAQVVSDAYARDVPVNYKELRDAAIAGGLMGGATHGIRELAGYAIGSNQREEAQRLAEEQRRAELDAQTREFADRYRNVNERRPEFARQGYRDAAALRAWADRHSGGVMSDEVFNYIVQTANEMGIPPQRLLAQAIAESNGNQDDVSDQGAIGVMQLIPETAEGLGVDPHDWKQNIRGGAMYLKQMYDQFGDWDLAHAAYNAGPNAVKRYGGIPPYSETQHYVGKINGFMSNTPEFSGEESGGEQSNDGRIFGVGNYDMPLWGDPNVSSLKAGWSSVIPQIGGVLKSMGFDPVITSGGRTHEHQMSINPSAPNSYHIIREEGGDAIDISLAEGGVTEEQAQQVLDYFKSTGLFKEVLYHDAGSGLHLHLGGLNTDAINTSRHSRNIQPAADSIYASKVRDAMRTPEQQKESANPPFEIKNSYDTSREIIERFARERAEKAVQDGDAETASFLHGMFDGDNFQNTKNNVTALENRYENELTAFAAGILAQSQQGTAQAQEQQAQPAQKSVQPNEPPKPKPAQSKQGNKFLRNEPVLQAANEHITKLRQSNNQDDQFKAVVLQNAVNNKTLAEVENLLKQYGLSTTPAQSQQQQSQPQSQASPQPENVVQNNTTPENVSPQPQEQPQGQQPKKKGTTGQERLIATASHPVKTGQQFLGNRKKQGAAIIKLANQNGITIPEDDQKRLKNGVSVIVQQWRDKLMKAGVFDTQPTEQQPTQQTQPAQEETQPQEETPQQPQPTLEERLNQVVQAGTEKARILWDAIHAPGKAVQKQRDEEARQQRQAEAEEKVRREAKEAYDRAVQEKAERDRIKQEEAAKLEAQRQKKEAAERAKQQKEEEQARQKAEWQSGHQERVQRVKSALDLSDDDATVDLAMSEVAESHNDRVKQGNALADLMELPQFRYSGVEVKHSDSLIRTLRTGSGKAIGIAQNYLDQLKAPEKVKPQTREHLRTQKTPDEVASEQRAREQKKAIKENRRARMEELADDAMFESELLDTRMQENEEIDERLNDYEDRYAKVEQADLQDELDFQDELQETRMQYANDVEETFENKIREDEANAEAEERWQKNTNDKLRRRDNQRQKNADEAQRQAAEEQAQREQNERDREDEAFVRETEDDLANEDLFENELLESEMEEDERLTDEGWQERQRRKNNRNQEPQPEPPTEPTEPTQPETQPEPPSEPEPTPPETRTEPQPEEPPAQNAKQTYTRGVDEKGRFITSDKEIIAGRKAILAAPAGTQVKATYRNGTERRHVIQQDEKGRRTFQELDENGNLIGKTYALNKGNIQNLKHFGSSDVVGIELSKYEPKTEDKGNGTETTTTQTAPNPRTQENNNQNPESGQAQTQPEVTEQREVTADDVNYRFNRWRLSNTKNKDFKAKKTAGQEILKRMNDPADPLTPNEAVAELKKVGIELPDVQRPQEQKPAEQSQQQKPEPKPEQKSEPTPKPEEPKTEPEQRPTPLEPNEFTPLFEVDGNTVTLKENPTKLTDSELRTGISRIARYLNANVHDPQKEPNPKTDAIIKVTFSEEFKDDKSDKTKIRDYFILKASKFLKDNADESKGKTKEEPQPESQPQEPAQPEKETQPEKPQEEQKPEPKEEPEQESIRDMRQKGIVIETKVAKNGRVSVKINGKSEPISFAASFVQASGKATIINENGEKLELPEKRMMSFEKAMDIIRNHAKKPAQTQTQPEQKPEPESQPEPKEEQKSEPQKEKTPKEKEKPTIHELPEFKTGTITEQDLKDLVDQAWDKEMEVELKYLFDDFKNDGGKDTASYYERMRDFFIRRADEQWRTLKALVTTHKKAPQSIKECKSIDDLAAYWRDKHNPNIVFEQALSQLYFPAVKEAFEGVEEVFKFYPDMWKKIQVVDAKAPTTFWGISHMRFTYSAYGLDMRLSFNKESFESAESVKETCNEQRFVKNCSAKSLGAHEAGHALANGLLRRSGKLHPIGTMFGDAQNINDSQLLFWASELLSPDKKTQLPKEELNKACREISDYALKGNGSETVAEAISDYITNGDKAAPLSKAIVQRIREALKGDMWRERKTIAQDKFTLYEKGNLTTATVAKWYDAHIAEVDEGKQTFEKLKSKAEYALYDRELADELSKTKSREKWEALLRSRTPNEEILERDGLSDEKINELAKDSSVANVIKAFGGKIVNGKVQLDAQGKEFLKRHLENMINPTSRFAIEAGADTETMDPVADDKLNPVQKAVKNFCKRINVPVVFFKGDPKFHGKFENGVVYLNVDSPISPDWVFHHEIGHWLAVNEPELFNQLVQMLNITDEQRNAHRKKTGQWQLNDDEVNAEILSDKFGDIAQLEGFFKEAAKKDSSLIDRAIRWLKDMLDKFTDFFFKKENGLTRSQRKNLYDRLGRIISRIVDEHGNRRYRYNRETHAIEYMDGTPLPALPRTKANDPNITRFSTASNSNSQESFSQRIRNKAAAFFSSEKPQRYKEEITKALSKVSKYRIMYGYTDDKNTDVVVDTAHKVITARHAYQWEKFLPTVGEKIAQELGLNPTDDMSRYIADWLMTGALNNNSQEAKDFAAAMRSNPAQAELLQKIRDTFQKMADMSPQEKILSTIVDREEKKSFLQKLKGKMTKEELLDDLAPLEAAVQRMVENAPPAVAKFIKENVDPYKMARLLKGKGAIADMMIGHDDMTESDMEKIRTALAEVYPNVNFADFQSLGMIIKSVGGDARGLEAYAMAKLDKEIHERNRAVDANGKPKYKFIEPTFEENDDDQVINDGKAKFDAAQQALVNFSNTLAAIQYTSGLKTQDQFYSLINGLKNYVPMERVFQEDENYKPYDSAEKKEGSKRDTYSPLQRLAANAHVLLKQAERNKVKLEIASLARLGNFGDVFVEVPKRANRENIITFKEGGVTKYLETPDMGIVRALESMQSKGDSNVIMTALKIATSFMRAAQTVRNLDFIAGNPARDLPDAYIHNKHLSMNPIRALVQVWKAGFKGVVTKDQDYYDFLAYGGAQSGFVSESSDSTARAINAIGQGERWDRLKGKHGLKGIFSQLWRDLETFAERSEYVTRLNTYKAAKAALAEQHGGTATKTDKSLAALEARSATVDFARAGKSIRSANQVIMFLNAAIQGLALWGEKLTPKNLKTKEGRRAVYSAAFRLAMMGILPAVVQAAANYSDDDRYKLYKNRPNWEKEMYWIFGDGAQVPKGMDVGIRLLATMTEEAMDWLFKNDPIEAKRIGAAFVNGFPSLTSTIFTPALESTVNYSIFRDAPIVPYSEQQLPDAMQYGLHTSKTAKFIGGLIDFSPRKIDHLISNYLGFMGKFASKVPNYWSDGSIPIDEMPMVRRYMFDPEKNPKVVQDYYDALGEQESIYRGWQEARKRGLKPELPDEYDRRLHAHLKAVQEAMQNISARERRIMDDPKLTSDQRKEKLRELERKRVALCERALGKAR